MNPYPEFPPEDKATFRAVYYYYDTDRQKFLEMDDYGKFNEYSDALDWLNEDSVEDISRWEPGRYAKGLVAVDSHDNNEIIEFREFNIKLSFIPKENRK